MTKEPSEDSFTLKELLIEQRHDMKQALISVQNIDEHLIKLNGKVAAHELAIEASRLAVKAVDTRVSSLEKKSIYAAGALAIIIILFELWKSGIIAIVR